MKTRRLIYTSRAVKEFTKYELMDLLHDSRAYNSIDKICGVLMHRNGHFLQVLEGEPDSIDNLLARLLRDPRHENLKIIHDSSVDTLLFSKWAMGSADLEAPELSLIPGLRADLSNPEVIQDLVIRLPDIASFLQGKGLGF
jgi:hypothetical protein